MEALDEAITDRDRAVEHAVKLEDDLMVVHREQDEARGQLIVEVDLKCVVEDVANRLAKEVSDLMDETKALHGEVSCLR